MLGSGEDHHYTAEDAAARVERLRRIGEPQPNATGVHVFASGSLIHHPELPEALTGFGVATLAGYRRAFNKVSSHPGCLKARSMGAFAVPELELDDGDRWRSIVLGTEARQGRAIRGVLLGYPEEARAELLARLDRREAGYRRATLPARHAASGASFEAIVYLTDASIALSIAEQAAVLANATSRVEPTLAEWRIGLYYLERVRASLRTLDIPDPDLESLAAAVHALGPGPWRDLVAAASESA